VKYYSRASRGIITFKLQSLTVLFSDTGAKPRVHYYWSKRASKQSLNYITNKLIQDITCVISPRRKYVDSERLAGPNGYAILPIRFVSYLTSMSPH
jgi:hypothetical protein